MRLTLKLSVFFALMLTLSTGVAAQAGKTAEAEAAKPQPASSTPHDVVDGVTTQLMKLVIDGKGAVKAEPQKFYTDVRAIMESAVDFQYIARNVMGAKHWKEANAEQRAKFVEVFTTGLIETYAKGMANFAEFDISVQPPSEPIGDQRKVEVMQKFKGPNGVNLVSYTMGKNKSGEWKLINVVLDGVNLGKTLRAQFSQSVKENEGNLDAAIKGWTWQSEEVRES